MKQIVSHYEIIEELGEGGMATVFKARDTLLGRFVAIKVIAAEVQDSQNFLKRFQREARALGNLTHPHIVQVLDYGEQEGIPFLVMDYLPGGTLKDRLGKSFSWQQAAGLLAPIARALAYAHDHKIIHRDVKPSNILFDAQNKPVLTDFGIAKVLEREMTLDLTGTGVIGTPQYMSPEQGMGKEIDFRSDIYSLGVVFYELLTGKRPFNETTPVGILLQQTRQVLTSPRQHNREIPNWVEQVVYAALAVKPDHRFESMAAFADVLEQMARGEKPILGRELIKRSQPKKKRSVTPLVAAIILSITLLVAVSGYWFGVVKNQGSAPTLIVAAASETLTITPTFQNTPTATSTETRPPLTPTTAIVTSTPTETPEPAQVDRSLSRQNIDQIEMLQVKDKLFGEIDSFALSPDGLTAVVAPVGNPGAIWDLQKNEIKQNLLGNNGLPLKVKEVAFSSDGKLVAGLVDYGDVWIWEAEDLTLTQRIPGKSQAMQFSPDSQKLAIHNYEELYAQIWDLANKTQTGQYIQRSKVEGLAFSTDSKFLWVNTSLSLNIWRVLDGTQVNQLDNIELANGSYTIISPRNDLFYTNGRLWNVGDFSLAHTISEAQDPYPCASFSSSGELLAVCDGNQVILWDTSDGRLIKTLETSFTSDILALIFPSNGNELIIAAKDGSVEYWGIRP